MKIQKESVLLTELNSKNPLTEHIQYTIRLPLYLDEWSRKKAFKYRVNKGDVVRAILQKAYDLDIKLTIKQNTRGKNGKV